MGTAILKVQHREARSDSSRSLLAAALDASPDPIAIVENGSVVYSNRSFADSEDSFLSRNGKNRQAPWQQTPFSANGRAFSLHTRQRNPSESQHLMLVGRLVSGVAHDFNNLLTGILLYCDLLGAKLTADEPMGRKIEEIRVAAEHGATLIRQLMCVGREAKGEPRYVSFSHAIEDVLPLLKHMVGENIHVSLKLKDNGATVAVSQAQAQQIILNLVLNARDAMPDGGLVRLETRARPFEGTGPGNRMFELVVTDTGPGMDAPTAARIFEPFFTTKERGTGMGLATVRHIAEDAGGLVCVDTSPGDGTRMTVRLPEVNINHATSCPDVLDAPALSTQR